MARFVRKHPERLLRSALARSKRHGIERRPARRAAGVAQARVELVRDERPVDRHLDAPRAGGGAQDRRCGLARRDLDACGSSVTRPIAGCRRGPMRDRARSDRRRCRGDLSGSTQPRGRASTWTSRGRSPGDVVARVRRDSSPIQPSDDDPGLVSRQPERRRRAGRDAGRRRRHASAQRRTPFTASA